jgi:hypothetical protein
MAIQTVDGIGGIGGKYDPLDAAYSNTFITFHHLLTDQKVAFKSFVTQFNDDHQSTWTEESVYGRMDNMATFSNTKRMITLNFDVPSVSVEEAAINLAKLSLLKQFLYPAYINRNNALAISSSPLIRIKFLNYMTNGIDENGLLGIIKNFAFAPNEEAGYHGVFNDIIYPKLFSISIGQFSVLHEHQLGWVKTGNNYIFSGNENIGRNYPLKYDITTADAAVTVAVNTNLAALNKETAGSRPTDEQRKQQEELILAERGGQI